MSTGYQIDHLIERAQINFRMAFRYDGQRTQRATVRQLLKTAAHDYSKAMRLMRGRPADGRTLAQEIESNHIFHGFTLAEVLAQLKTGRMLKDILGSNPQLAPPP